VLSGVNDCPDNLVCVEWEYTVDGKTVRDDACCIDESKLGSTSWFACDTYFRHDHQGGS
jgi:hypothetical protein